MLRPLARPGGTTRTPPAFTWERRGSPAVKLIAIVLVLGVAASTGLAASAQAQGVTGSLSGTVTDAEGNGIGGVQVVLKRQVAGSSWLYHETTTADSGAYSLAGLEQGTWNLSFHLDAFRSENLSITIGLGEAKTHNQSLMAIGAYYYSGTVKHGENGEPISGAIVRVSSWNMNGQQTREVETAADGTFKLRLFATENSISIMKGGFATYHDWVYNPGEDIARGEIRLHPVPPQSAVVAGRIVDADGNGVQAYVSMYPDYSQEQTASDAGYGSTEPAAPDIWYPGHHENNHNSTVSAADGTFQMNAYPGAVVVEANRVGYLVARTTSTLTDGGTTEITLELARLPERSVTLTGTVRNAQNGTPVSGASVNVQVPSAGDYAWTTTDAEGRFQVTVRPGYTLIEVNHWGGDVIYYAEEVEAQPAADPPAESDGNTSSGSSGTSMPSPMPPGGGSNGPRYHPATTTLTTQPNSSADVDIRLTPRPEPTTTVVGYVVDATTNQAIANANVALQNHDTSDWGDTRTDGDGSFQFRTNGGYHTLRVHVEGYLPFATNVQVQGSGTQRVDLLVTPGQWANEGWWSPDGSQGGGGEAPTPRPMPLSEGESAPAMSDGSADRASSETAGFDMDGARSIQGGAGGLGPYTPMGDSSEAPTPALVLVLVTLGAVLAAVRRRRA